MGSKSWVITTVRGKQIILSSVQTGQVCGGEGERSTNFHSSTQVIPERLH